MGLSAEKRTWRAYAGEKKGVIHCLHAKCPGCGGDKRGKRREGGGKLTVHLDCKRGERQKGFSCFQRRPLGAEERVRKEGGRKSGAGIN